MVWLKIALQIVIGLITIGVIIIDYLWHDKRKTNFKKVRTWLIYLTVAFLVGSVSLTIWDDSNQKQSKHELTRDLAAVQDSLSIIKNIGTDLNDKIGPFLKWATEKYPNLPENEALKRMQTDIVELELKTDSLERKETSRKRKELGDFQLKNTPPKVEFSLHMVSDILKLKVQFLNEVPVSMKLEILKVWDSSRQYMSGTKVFPDQIKIFPPEENNGVAYYDIQNINEIFSLPRNRDLGFSVSVKYRSFYANQSANPEKAERSIILKYLWEPDIQKLTEIK